MSMTDPIADFLTRIRNGITAAHETVEIPASKLKTRAGPHPQGAGLHRGLRASRRRAPTRPASMIVVQLKYTDDRTPVISGHPARVAPRPADLRRRHATSRKVHGGMGTAIMSTSHGVMTGHEARKAGVGGEVVAKVW